MDEAEHSSRTGNNRNEVVDFECNICFDLAQDPVITLCGHLHCWPCLYKWLRVHSRSHECPVCKALIEEEKLIPLYGRGSTPSDPRSKPVPGTGLEIPNRPTGQRPETAPAPAPPPEDNSFSNGVFGPREPAAFSNFGMLASFGGVLSPVLGVQFNGLLNGGYSSGFRHYGHHPGSFHEPEGGLHVHTNDEKLKKILYFLLFFLLFALLTL